MDISVQAEELIAVITDFFSVLKISEQPFFALDILIVGSLFYFFYLFLRQTRALGILYGILILVILGLLGQLLNLVLLNTLLRWAFTSILVAIPVVFQPELRSALEKLGRTTKFVTDFHRLTKNQIDDVVGEIMKAAVILSQNKYGGLFILSRSSGLKEFTEKGERLDSKLNYKLLISIFTPKAPLHDGAVIIAGNKIIAASVTLPLSNEVLDLSLGTRHKAALSFSNETDSIGIVVSEETGSISLAVDGELLPDLPPEEVHKKIVRLLTTRKYSIGKK